MLSNSHSLEDTWLGTRPTAESVSDSEATQPSTSYKRDTELWFEDGNLVLVAEDVEFKLYRGPLIAHSLVFKDMLSLPQPPDRDESCPVIPLYDSPNDLRHVLRVFVPGSTLRSVHSECSSDLDDVLSQHLTARDTLNRHTRKYPLASV